MINGFQCTVCTPTCSAFYIRHAVLGLSQRGGHHVCVTFLHVGVEALGVPAHEGVELLPVSEAALLQHGQRSLRLVYHAHDAGQHLQEYIMIGYVQNSLYFTSFTSRI